MIDLDAILGPATGAEIPGGCDDCDAFQTVAKVSDGVWKLTVHHDDGCPTLARIQSRQGR